MQEILDFLQSLDWSPLVISIKTGIVATILSFFFGIFAARAVMKLRPGARAVIDGFLTLPMILPPTVAGFFLLLIFSLRRPFGAALYENFSIKAVQTWLGCILAATIIAFPLMYRNTRAAFEQVDTNLIYAVVGGFRGAAVADAPDPTVRRGMRDVVLVLDSARRLAVLVKLHDLPLERLLVVAGMFRAGHRRPPIPCHSSLIGLSNTL